jgi:hypothetical protein
MKLAFNFKNGKKIILTEEETSRFLKRLNYLKLLKLVTSSKGNSSGTFMVKNKEIKSEELSSIEMHL